jgi:type I site-specific restriction-modification system R (restriction) subunit
MNDIYAPTRKDEYDESEEPAIHQLRAMGYDYLGQIELNKERRDFREVLLYDRLEAAIRRINPELDEDGVYEALDQINETNFPYTLDVMDTNERIRAKLVGLSRSGGLEPITVTQNLGEGNVDKTVKLFDFDNLENNDFLVTNQFQLDGLKLPIYPDIIIFVNGIPLVIIECKSPYITDPIQEAVEKNFERYQSRGAGYERLMFFNHFLIATCGTVARHGTIGSRTNHYARWSEAYPQTIEDIEKICGRKPREQENKVFGPLLDKYSFEESKEDGATLKILYEGRMPDLYVEEDGDTIDTIFERVFTDLDQDTKLRLKKEHVTKEKIAEAPARIRKICLDLIEHYTKHIEPNGYKGMIVATSRDAAVTYKRELDKLYAPKSKIIMTSHLGEKEGNWDEYYLTPEQREDEAERFKSPEDETKLLIVVDMLLVGYDVPIVQVMYLDKVLKEHTLLQAIARVNRLYDKAKTYGLIVDYCGITKDLQKALAIFEEEDIQGALEPAEKELEELKNRHREAMSFFNDIGKEDNSAIIEKFEPVNVRDDFEYAFKMFSKALDVVLPKKEAEAHIEDFKYLSRKRVMIRNSYEAPGHNLRLDGKKVQQLMDDYVRSLKIEDIMDQRGVTYNNFLGYASKFKTEELEPL